VAENLIQKKRNDQNHSSILSQFITQENRPPVSISNNELQVKEMENRVDA